MYESYDDYLDDMTGENDREQQEKDDWECEQADLKNDEAKLMEYLDDIGWND